MKRIKEDAGRGLSEFVETDRPNRFYLWAAALGLGVNLFSWFVAFATPEAVSSWVGLAADISDKFKGYLLAVPFWSFFLFVFALIRMIPYRNPTNAIEDGSMFGSYRESERNNYLRKLLLLSLAAASVNTILLALTVISSG
jgi:hypothetical protein